MGRKRTSAKQALSYSFLAAIALIVAVFGFIKENFIIFIVIVVIIAGVTIYFFYK
jgi:hypothetical protein